MFQPLGAQTPASKILPINSFGTGSGFSRLIDRAVRMISNRSAVLGAASLPDSIRLIVPGFPQYLIMRLDRRPRTGKNYKTSIHSRLANLTRHIRNGK
jgi:hypothetical protein